ncbi:MAG: 4Fe-4S dicluster domain-containing protein, partial [bacterium]
LKKEYSQLLGPTLREGSLVYDEIASVDDLPIGMIDEQDAASYRLMKSELPTLFGYVVGQHSWKRFLHPPEEQLWQAQRNGKDFELLPPRKKSQPCALVGVRSCELAALQIHDKVLEQGPYRDPNYRQRRESAFVLAVNCTRPGGTCFCGSMGTGPKATQGFDLALTEVCREQEHYFLVEIGSAKGATILQGLPVKAATSAQIEVARKLLESASRNMGRELSTDNLKSILYDQFDSLHWEEIAKRCLSCANCTMVCPTCFCSNVEDSTDLTGTQVSRLRHWDSCYSVDFSYIHGGSIRNSVAARYRQWLTHKLAYWVDQFGTFGCVGCGRCITWCPAAIDITEEAKAFRAAANNSEVV